MQYFLLLLYFSIFSIISSFPTFNEGNNEDSHIALGSYDQSIDPMEDSTLAQSDSLIPVAPSPSSIELDNYGNQFDPIPLDDKEQKVPLLDSSILMTENSPNKNTQIQGCYREKEITHKILCFAAAQCTYDALA